MYVAGRLSNYYYFFKETLLLLVPYYRLLCVCVLYLFQFFKERKETGERKSERGESLEGIKLSRDSSMSVQRLTIIIYYRTRAVCSFKRFAFQ